MNKSNFKVDFIGIGEGKSATSWIFKCIKEHPQICGAIPKETHFFDRHYEDGIERYKKFFSHCKERKIKGEYTPGYLRHQETAKRIKQHFPQAKLICCLRDPLGILISRYYFRYSRGKSDSILDLNSYLKEINLERVKYFKNLTRFLKLFPRKQIIVLLYEDIEKNPQKFIQEIYKFLEVDSSIVPESALKKANETVTNKVRFRFLNKSLWRIRKFIRRKRHSKQIIKIMRVLGLNFLAKKAFALNRRKGNFKTVKKAKPSEKIAREIKAELKEDIINLEKLINRDLSSWYE